MTPEDNSLAEAIRQGHTELALQQLRQQPLAYDDAALMQLMLLAEQKAWSEAKLLCWQLIDLQPADVTVRLLLSCIHWQLGEYAQMQTLLSPFRLWPMAESLPQKLIAVLLAFLDGKHDSAQQLLTQARADADAQWWLTLIMQMQQLLPAAVSTAAAESSPPATVQPEPAANILSPQFLQGLYQQKY